MAKNKSPIKQRHPKFLLNVGYQNRKKKMESLNYIDQGIILCKRRF